MARITITFDGAPVSQTAIARTNADNLDPGDIIEDRESRRFKVIEPATIYDYLAQCQEAEIEVDEGKLLEDRDKLWRVEVWE